MYNFLGLIDELPVGHLVPRSVVPGRAPPRAVRKALPEKADAHREALFCITWAKTQGMPVGIICSWIDR